MSQNKLNAVTDAEWEVMRIIWTQGKTTSREVQTILNEKKLGKPLRSKLCYGVWWINS